MFLAASMFIIRLLGFNFSHLVLNFSYFIGPTFGHKAAVYVKILRAERKYNFSSGSSLINIH